MDVPQHLSSRVLRFFTESHDFNGIRGTSLSEELGIDYLTLLEHLKEMVKNDVVSIQTGINPHIISLGHFSIETQLDILEDAKNNKTERTLITDTLEIVQNSHEFCVYPSQAILKKQSDSSTFLKAPYSEQLALGEPQLKAMFFDIEVLDRYYRDPRFSFDFKDYSGQISYTVDDKQNPVVGESDQIFMQTFGIGHDSQGNRLAVVFLRYLHGLTSEHQLFWKSKERTSNDCKMLKEYHDNTIMGAWTFSYSVFTAFLFEQKALNDLAKRIFGIGLFRDTYEDQNRPKEFTFFFIPTLDNYNNFVLLLDKMLSDNIDKSFFMDNVDLFDFETVGEGQVERKPRGTLRLLKEWLIKMFHLENPDDICIITDPLTDIRKQRQHPAHKIKENIYDKSYLKKQKELIEGAYQSMRQLRNIFQMHPEAKGAQIPEWLETGDIKSF